MSKLKCPHCGGDVYPEAGLPNARQRQRWDEERDRELGLRKRNREIAASYCTDATTYEKLGLTLGLSREQVRIAIFRAQQEAEREARYQEYLSAAKSIEDMPLDTLDLPVRMRNIWWEHERGEIRELKLVGEVSKIPDDKLLTYGNLGRATLYRWKQCLAELKCDFANLRRQPGKQRTKCVDDTENILVNPVVQTL
jgi:hypothetical protein